MNSAGKPIPGNGHARHIFLHVAYFSQQTTSTTAVCALCSALAFVLHPSTKERASSLVRIVASMAAQGSSEDGGVVDADVSEGAPTAPVNPQTRLAMQEIKSEIVSELMWQLQDAESTTSALAAQTEKIEAIRSALQVRAGIQSRADVELRAASEQLCNTMNVYKIFRGVNHTYCFVPDRDDRATAVKRAHQAFAVARHRQARALKSVAESHALRAQLDRRLQKEEIKLELLDSAFTFSSKLQLYAAISARLDQRRRARR